MNVRHSGRLILSTAGAAVSVAGLLLAGAWLGDRVSSQSDEAVQPAIEEPVVLESGSDPDSSDSSDGDVDTAPGAVMAVADSGPAVHGLPGGAWSLPTDLIATDASEPEPGRPTDPQQPNEPFIPASDASAVAERLGIVAQQPPPVITQFVDLCTTGATLCPLGVGATVVPLAGDLPPGGLKVQIVPGVTKALAPGLRWDPGYGTSQRLPVVVSIDAPVFSVEVKLRIPGVGVLDELTLKEQPSETAWHAQWVAAGKAAGTDLDNGLQYCASLRTEGAWENSTQLAGVSLPSPLVYRVSVRAVALVGPAVAKATVDYAATPPGSRPPTIVHPLTGHTAQVVVSEVDPDRYGPPLLWVTSRWAWQTSSAEAQCALPPKEGTPVGAPESQTYDPGQLASISYPFDPEYSHYRVWNLVLEEATTYALCIQWQVPGGTETEAWTLETPDGLRFSLYLQSFTEVGYTSGVWMIGAPEAACYPWTVEDTMDVLGLPTDEGTGRTSCRSNGLPFPSVTTFELTRRRKGTNTEEDMGSKRLMTPTWCATGPPVITGVAPAAEGQWKYGQCGAAEWPTTFVYSDQNVLCGYDCSDEYKRAELKAVVYIEEGPTNGRRDPLAWIIEGPPGERAISLPGGAPGPGLPGP